MDYTITNISPWQRVCSARDKDRPRSAEIIEAVFDEFVELHGDRLGAEDAAIIGGIALLEDTPVTVLAHRKGKTTDENIKYNFGMPGAAGYRKALRLMRQAEKFKRPVITFIDTPGAYPGISSEENGISVAIAECLAGMSTLKIPVIAVVTGEGGSGGALALGVADRILMLENAVYSVLSPEGFASILWKDGALSKKACEVMKLTAQELKEYGICDDIIPEPQDGIRESFKKFSVQLKRRLKEEIQRLSRLSPNDYPIYRYEKFRHFEGAFAPAVK